MEQRSFSPRLAVVVWIHTPLSMANLVFDTILKVGMPRVAMTSSI
jgi:hypothetical protein